MSQPPETVGITEGWRPHPGPQTRALSIDIPELLYGGARGGGKTDAGIAWIGAPGADAMAHPRYRGLVIRKNGKDLREWVDRAYMRWAAYGVRKAGNQSVEFRWPSGAAIHTGHLADKDAYEHYQGMEFQRLLVEEATQIPDEERYLRLKSSCRTSVPELRPAVFLTCNPGGPGHSWVKQRFLDPAPAGTPFRGSNGLFRVFIPARLEDNPTLMLADPSYEAFLNGLPDALRRAWRDGDWDAFEGQYFLEWSRERHVRPAWSPPRSWSHYRAVDWGYWPNPWACVWVAVDHDGNEICYREARGWRMTPEQVALRILELSAEDGDRWGPTAADPSMWSTDDGQSHAERFAAAGLPLVQAYNDRVQGWMRLHEYLAINQATGRPWLQVCDSCLELIRVIPQLIHDDIRVEDVTKDAKLDHLPDALRYHLMRRPSRAEVEDQTPPWRSLEGFERIIDRLSEGD